MGVPFVATSNAAAVVGLEAGGGDGANLDAAVAILDKIPLKHGWRTHIAAPLFHTWGFAHLALGQAGQQVALAGNGLAARIIPGVQNPH